MNETKMFRAWWNTYLITNHFSLNWDIKVFNNQIGEVVVWRYIDSIPYKAILDSNNYPQETVERITKLFKEWNWL